MRKLFNKPTTPYYIVTPPYTHISSGVRTLHLLAHALNTIGQRAYVAITEGQVTENLINPEWLTPIFTKEVEDYYKDFIAVYPDIIWGNPLMAKKVVRYLLAPPGAYGGPKEFLSSDQIWGCTTPIGGKNLLIVPPSDPDIYKLPPLLGPDNIRSGACYYAHKYDRIHGQQLQDITKDAVRLEGTQQEIADILRRSEVCYVYEFSQIILDAGLCGCPVILVRTPYFNKLPEIVDWSFPHVKWNDESDTIDNIRSPLWRMDVLREYRDSFDKFWDQLKDFVRKTQQWDGV